MTECLDFFLGDVNISPSFWISSIAPVLIHSVFVCRHMLSATLVAGAGPGWWPYNEPPAFTMIHDFFYFAC